MSVLGMRVSSRGIGQKLGESQLRSIHFRSKFPRGDAPTPLRGLSLCLYFRYIHTGIPLLASFLSNLPFTSISHSDEEMPDMMSLGQPQQRQFNPYSENGGTILAIAGADFSVIAGDTRQSEGYSIQTRYAPKVFRL